MAHSLSLATTTSVETKSTSRIQNNVDQNKPEDPQTRPISLNLATSETPRLSSSKLNVAVPKLPEMISSKFIPRLRRTLNVPKDESDKFVTKILDKDIFKSWEKLPLELTVYFLLQYIDDLETYALKNARRKNKQTNQEEE